MGIILDLPLTFLANTSAASNVMQSFITPTIATLCALASLACTFFLVTGGIQYMTSSGNPDKLEQAKKLLKNALIGLVLVIAAASLTAILSNAYSSSTGSMSGKMPLLQSIEQPKSSNGLFDVMMDAIIGLLRNIVKAIGEPFINALGYFINSTPLMGDNSSVFNLWLAVVGITNVLFILIVCLLGFQFMSATALGFEEIELKQLLPQLAAIFLLVNTSIFAIDAVISLSNGMIYALQSGFASTDIWLVLTDITKESGTMGLAGLLMMVAFLILVVILLVYYVARILALYIGAILSPLVVLLWLLPAFKDFAMTALKTYLTTIFVLFVHVVIWLLAASIFVGMLDSTPGNEPNTIMALIVGIATITTLLKTQGVMKELSYAASAPRAARQLSGSFVRGVSHLSRSARGTYTGIQKRGLQKKLGGAADARKKYYQSKTPPSPGEGGMVSKSKPSVNNSPLKTGETRKAGSIGKDTQ